MKKQVCLEPGERGIDGMRCSQTGGHNRRQECEGEAEYFVIVLEVGERQTT